MSKRTVSDEEIRAMKEDLICPMCGKRMDYFMSLPDDSKEFVYHIGHPGEPCKFYFRDTTLDEIKRLDLEEYEWE